MIDFDLIPKCEHPRVTELMILMQASFNGRLVQVEPELRASWRRQLESLASKESVENWLVLVAAQALDNGNQLRRLIEKYQNSDDLFYETNFSLSKYFSECALSERIGLLYEIGSEAGLLKQSETFDNRTRVTQAQQEVCNRVVRWVEKTLQISLVPINVYASFIYDYQRREYKREQSLYQIGIRAGLLEDKPVDQLTQSDQARVIAWVKDTFQIDLNKSSETPEVDASETLKDLIDSVALAKSVNGARRATMNGLLLLLLVVPVGGLLYQYVAQSQSYSSESPKLAQQLKPELGEDLKAVIMPSIQPKKCQ